jgi:hypothetical protein
MVIISSGKVKLHAQRVCNMGVTDLAPPSTKCLAASHIRLISHGTSRAIFPPMNGIENTTEDRFNMKKGVLGALLGAGAGIGLMFAFYTLAGFRFPLLGVGIGILTGFCAKFFYKGTDTTLGYISASIALAAVVGTLYLMYGTFPLMSIISVIVSASVAYRLASS